METSINRNRLFIASCFALITTALAFSLRAGMVNLWAEKYSLSIEEVGWINGTAFWGFTLAMVIGGPLCDVIGMKRLAWLAFFGHLTGIVLTMLANSFWSLFLSTLVIGIANGTVEAACNPLVASMYNTEKTKMLNRFHMWFPGGNVIGGLLGYFLGTQLQWDWQLQIGAMLIPTILYGIMFFGQTFPVTERVSSGVSTGAMFKECAKPLFLFMVFCMFITAATELGTTQLIQKLLEGTGTEPILVFVFIFSLMAIGRLFAGPVVHRLAPSGMLWISSILSAIGLIWLSYASDPATTFLAAFVFAAGVCFFWPTMLGFVAEYLPKTGALGLSIMGGAGMLAVSLVLPILGGLLDKQSGAETLRSYSVLPIFLSVAFGGLFFYMRNRKPTEKVVA